MENISPEVGFRPISHPELETNEKYRLTMENVQTVFGQAKQADNPNDKLVWANDLASHTSFYEKSLEQLKPKIAELLLQLQPRFFKGYGYNQNDTIFNEFQERWDTSGTESKRRFWFWNKNKRKGEGRYASQLISLAKASKLGKTTTSRSELTASPRTIISFWVNREACEKTIEDSKKK